MDAARHRQEKREATGLENVFITQSGEFCEATPIVLAVEPKDPVRARDGLRPA